MTEPGVLWHHAYLLTSMTVFSVVRLDTYGSRAFSVAAP